MSLVATPNQRVARWLAAELAASGVTDACVSPGSRSTALALALEGAGLRAWVLTDERSAGFFALGIARASRRPVALVCTSGTAAANFLPAVVEASLSCVPLVVLTADRPPELRDCRAAQTIDQVRLFGSHARWSVDVSTPEERGAPEAYYRTLACRAVAAALEPPAGPVHLNLPMREPLIDVAEEVAHAAEAAAGGARIPWVRVHAASGEPSAAALAAAETLRGVERGLVVCGPETGESAAAPVAALAAALGWPILADPLSGLRFGGHDRSHVVDAYDVLLRDPGFSAAHAPEVVLQLGSPPVSKTLERFLTAASRGRHLLVAPPGIWPDPLHRASEVLRAEPAALAAALAARLGRRRAPSVWLESWRDAASAVRRAIDEALDGEASLFEGKVFRVLAARLAPGTALHVGNSLPVRHLDTFLGAADLDVVVHGNRGASGIDGVLSTAAGAAAALPGPTVLVLGDLSFLHDLGGLQAVARHRLHLVVLVLNNDGGGIFSFLPQAGLDAAAFEKYFGTPHGLDVAGAVATCGGRLVRPRSWGALAAAVGEAVAGSGLHVIELVTDRAATRERYSALVTTALERLRDGAAARGSAA